MYTHVNVHVCHRQRVRHGRDCLLLDQIRLKWYREPTHGLYYRYRKCLGRQSTCLQSHLESKPRAQVVFVLVCTDFWWIGHVIITSEVQSGQPVYTIVLPFENARLSCFRAVQLPSAKKSTARTSEPSSSQFSAFDIQLLSSNRTHLLLCFLRRSQVRYVSWIPANDIGGWAYPLTSGCCIMPRAISRGMLLWLYYLKEDEGSGWNVTIILYSSFPAHLLILCGHETYNARQACRLTADDL